MALVAVVRGGGVNKILEPMQCFSVGVTRKKPLVDGCGERI